MADVIALVGGDTLLGREVREVAGESSLGDHLRLVAAEGEEAGRLTIVGKEPAVVAKLDRDAIESARVLILAGTAESSKEALKMAPEALVIDLTGVIEEDPEARVRGPLVESEDGNTDDDFDRLAPRIVAHPAAVAIAAVLKKLAAAAPLRSASVHIFEPASERGKAGIEELQLQSVNLLSFKPLPKTIFDAQLGFAMLPRLGEAASVSLDAVETRIERHLASLLERMDGLPMPSIRLIQAPVFHGYSFSFHVTFDEVPDLSEIEAVLDEAPLEFRGEDTSAPDNVGIAGQSGVVTGALSADRNAADAIWLWAAADNLRISAENALRLASEVL